MNEASRDGSAKRESWGNCPACGFHNGDWETRCGKCGRRLSALRAASRTAKENQKSSSLPELVAPQGVTSEGSRRPAPQPVPRPPAFPEHLRQHLQDRVHRYRARQENPSLRLPFEEELEPPAKIISFPTPPPPAGFETRVPAPRPAREPAREPAHEKVPESQTASPQAGLDFQTSALPTKGTGAERNQQWRLRAVAPLPVRLQGHMKDLQFIGGALLLFSLALPLASWMGAAIIPKLILIAGLLGASILLTLLYGLLFLWGAGATPGMRAARLRVVNFDGQPATRRQRLWRFLGAIVSGGSFLIGFLWAMVDEEKLYWHDHISKTYLTLADPQSD